MKNKIKEEKGKIYRVIDPYQHRDFISQTEARAYAIRLLEAGVFFLEIKKVDC